LAAQAFYRRFEVSAVVGNGLDTLSLKPGAVFNDSSNGFPFAVEFDYGLTTAKPVLSLGDSITAGNFTDATNSTSFGFIQSGVLGISTPATPYSIANGGSPGQGSTTFFNQANDMLDLGLRPAYIVAPSFSVNDAGNDDLSTAIIDAYYVKVDALIAKVAGYSPKPKFVGWTGLPRGTYGTTSEAARQYAHTQMRNRVTGGSVYKCVEISAAIQDGSTPPRLQAIYDSGDGTHPNSAARSVMASLLAAAFP
jgi:lysophospholipase L1-like esterase